MLWDSCATSEHAKGLDLPQSQRVVWPFQLDLDKLEAGRETGQPSGKPGKQVDKMFIDIAVSLQVVLLL